MIVVTGATGNVGAELVSALARAGEPVRALVRELGRPVPDGVEPVVGDLNNPGSLRAALQGTNAAEYVDASFTFYVDGAIDESEVLPTVEDVTGVAPRPFAQWVEAHADAFV